jgi:hypothetical protein
VNSIAVPVQHRAPHDGHQPDHLSAVEGDLSRGYSQNIFQGPSLSPSGYQFAKYDAILEEYQRNSTDDFTGRSTGSRCAGTKLTFEEQIDHYKADSYFTMAPGDFIVQEADGTPVAIDDYDSQTPYPSGACNANSIGTTPILSAPNTRAACRSSIRPALWLPAICARSRRAFFIPPRFPAAKRQHQEHLDERRFALHQREHEPAQLLRQLPGLNGTTRSLTYTANAQAKRGR